MDRPRWRDLEDMTDEELEQYLRWVTSEDRELPGLFVPRADESPLLRVLSLLTALVVSILMWVVIWWVVP